MKKLSYEDGHLVIRDLDGKLYWSAHVIDVVNSYQGKPELGGYKEILIEGKLTETNFISNTEKTLNL